MQTGMNNTYLSLWLRSLRTSCSRDLLRKFANRRAPGGRPAFLLISATSSNASLSEKASFLFQPDTV